MHTVKQQVQDELISCEVCFREVPVSQAKNEEGSEYVMHYFGLECYSRWKQQSGEESPPKR
jgi:Domain of unknown function (DUF3330)